MIELTEMATLVDDVANLLLEDLWPFSFICISVSLFSVAFRVISGCFDYGSSVGTVSSLFRDTYEPEELDPKEEREAYPDPVVEPELPDPPVKVLSRYAFTITCPNCGASVSGDSKQCAYCDSYFIRQVNSRRL